MAEQVDAGDLKSPDFGRVGSIPSIPTKCGCSSIGRASAFQAECCRFDSDHPLRFFLKKSFTMLVFHVSIDGV